MGTFGRGTPKYGTITGWEFQGGNNPESNKREASYDEINNETGSTLYDARIAINERYKATVKATVAALPANIGMHNSLALEQINVTTKKDDFAEINLVGHEHVDGTDNGDVRSVAHGMTLDRTFGVSLFGFTGVTEPTESSLAVKCEHTEVPGDGDTASGQNHNPMIEMSVTAYDGYATASEGWDVTEEAPTTDAEGYQLFTTRATKALAFTEA
jgi:hypothetical protein